MINNRNARELRECEKRLEEQSELVRLLQHEKQQLADDRAHDNDELSRVQVCYVGRPRLSTFLRLHTAQVECDELKRKLTETMDPMKLVRMDLTQFTPPDCQDCTRIITHATHSPISTLTMVMYHSHWVYV